MKKLTVCIAICMALLALISTATAEEYMSLALTAEERAAANLFLSNFTETGISEIDDYLDDMQLVDFAHDHLWFNDNDSFEYGEYSNGNNCRVSDDRIQEIVDKYFYGPRQVDLSCTRYDYADGYYYHCETGGFVPDGFAYVTGICPIGDGVYFVSFMVFGGGNMWDNSVLDDPLSDIVDSYGHPNGYGSALIHADDLADRSTYRMIAFSRL